MAKTAKKKTASKKKTAKTTKPVKKKTASKKKTAKKVVSAVAKGGMPSIGKAAPALNLSVGDGDVRKLSSFKGKSNVVLYFYPKDDTPGCTMQACAFQKDLGKIEKAGAVVIGVSPDKLKSHDKFKTKYGLDFLLASDEALTAAKTYGVWVEKNMYGRKYMGVQRATFLIDREGRVAAVWPKVKVDGHSAEVIAKLGELG